MRAVGLALPAVRSAGGYFASKNAYDTAWGNLILAMMCPVGARFYQRSWGSGTAAVLFDPNDAVLRNELASAIREVAAKYVPSVRILEIVTTSSGTSLSVRVSFTLSTDLSAAAPATRYVQLDRSATIKYLSARSR